MFELQYNINGYSNNIKRRFFKELIVLSALCLTSI